MQNPPQSDKPSGKIESLQMLRAVAALLVAAFHLNASAVLNGGYTGVFNLFEHGESGVDLFFVLSGFIIYFTAAQKPGLTARQFLAARFYRIVPPYWAVLACYIGLAVVLAQALGDASKLPELQTLLISVFILPYPDHVIIIAWTLALELVFYGIFALSYFRFGRAGLLTAMGIWVGLSIALRVQDLFDPRPLAFLLHSAVLEFLFGILIAMAVLAGRAPLRLPALFLGVALFISYLMSGTLLGLTASREIVAGIPAAFIVYGLTGLKGRQPASVLLAGDASYLLYLGHLLLFSVLLRAADMAFGFDLLSSSAAMWAMLAAALGVSMALSYYLERPYHAWARRRLKARATRAAQNRTV